MSAFSPPTYYFTGIKFNSAFYNANTADLTLAQANALYLKKTVADTASALETFTGGILSNSINSTSAITDMSIAASQTDGILNIGSGARTATGVVNIANTAGNKCAVNIMNIGGSVGNVTAGSINIGNGPENLSPAYYTTSINIGAGKSSGQISIGNPDCLTNINSGSVNIGAANNDISIGNATAGIGIIRIASGVGANTTAVDLAAETASGLVRIGNPNNTTNLRSATLNVTGNLTIGTGKNITLQPTATYVAPTTDTMLGGITSGSFLTPNTGFSANKIIATISLVKGTFIIYYNFDADLTSVPTFDSYVTFDTTGTALPFPNYFVGGSRLSNAALGYSLSFPYSCTTAGTLLLKYTISGGTINAITQYTYSAIRIA